MNLFLVLLLFLPCFAWAQVIYVSPRGNDKWAGTEKKPVATFDRARQLAGTFPQDTEVEVIFEDGTYYLPETIRFSTADSKQYPANVTYKSRNEGKAIISGGERLNPEWRQTGDGIYVAGLPPGTVIDQLYVNGICQQMARFPNADPGGNKNVYDTWELDHGTGARPGEDPLEPDRIASWKNPAGGYIHAMHNSLWGDMHWLIKGKNEDGTLKLSGGWQNNRPSPMHPGYRIAENIREELDAPGEWYFDREEGKLYYIPFPGADMQTAKIETVRLKHLIEFCGSKENPVQGIVLKGLVFRHTARTFMENKEPLLRSDWTIYRGGAVVFNGAEDCRIENCEFDQVGGNTVFVNNYNRRITIRGCYIHHSGANGVAFVGNPEAVRSPLFRYGSQNYREIDRISGPKGDDYPRDCVVEDCLITMTGRYEKQTAPVQISISHGIQIRYCSIYDVPRAGININEGTFGGHIIEYCDIFNTVLETGDHGSFNSWGRDRFWDPDVSKISDEVKEMLGLPYLDILGPNILRNNRWRCDHGWDIDLDDGSSHYRIYNNLLLNGGLKLREGYDRIVTNNIILNNSLHPHVWVRQSGDVFKYNIIFGAYRPAAMGNALGPDDKWGRELDYNLFVSGNSDMVRFAGNGADHHSITGDPLFVDPANSNFQVKDNSPALSIGFRNFEMTTFGVRSPRLKAIAKTPVIPELHINLATRTGSDAQYTWLGASLKEPSRQELSAYGVTFESGGVAFYKVPEQSKAFRLGFRNGDLLQQINCVPVVRIGDLQQYLHEHQEKLMYELIIIRNQQEVQLKVEQILETPAKK